MRQGLEAAKCWALHGGQCGVTNQLCLKGYVASLKVRHTDQGFALRAAGVQGGVFSGGGRMTRWKEGLLFRALPYLPPLALSLASPISIFLGLTSAKSMSLPVPVCPLASWELKADAPQNTHVHARAGTA